MITHPQCRLGKEKTNMAYRDEIDDAFDAVVFLEERYSFTFTMFFFIKTEISSIWFVLDVMRVVLRKVTRMEN